MPRKLPPPPPGFPWQGKFSEVAQIRDYFAQEKLQCLLCGREYGNLGLHITRGHSVSHDDYKAEFGIPWTYGLAGTKFKTTLSRRFKKMIKEGKIKKPTKAHLKNLHAATRKKNHPIVEAFRKESRRKLLEQHGRKDKWRVSDYEEFINRIAQQRTPAEVGSDQDMPSKGAFLRFIKDNPKLQKRFTRVWEDQPYSVHARAGQPTEKFYKEVLKLRRNGATWGEIGNELEVSEHAARSAWHRWKAQGRLKPSDKKHEFRRYTRADYNEFMRRVSTGRMITKVAKDTDMPQSDLFYIYMRNNPDYKKAFQAMWDKLPYKFQAQSRRMSKKFREDVRKLHKQGYDWQQISQMLGVSATLVKSHYR